MPSHTQKPNYLKPFKTCFYGGWCVPPVVCLLDSIPALSLPVDELAVLEPSEVLPRGAAVQRVKAMASIALALLPEPYGERSTTQGLVFALFKL